MSLQFSDTIDALTSNQVWRYASVPDGNHPDVAAATYAALQTPTDFPPLSAAVVAGDRVTLAVDPNVPQIGEVIRGVVRALSETDADGVDVVLWDEASDETIEAIRSEMVPTSRIVRHRSNDRRQLSYLAADESAEPIYLNRLLVDADFVLPIMAGRPSVPSRPRDLTGVYPWLADSAARTRYRDSPPSAAEENARMAAETTWLLGVQIMLCVSPSADGAVHQVTAGTIESVAKTLHQDEATEADFPPPAPLIVASLDGGPQQQTWANAARAARAAMDHVLPGGTIVLWTDITDLPSGAMSPDPAADDDFDDEDDDDPPRDDDDRDRKELDNEDDEADPSTETDSDDDDPAFPSSTKAMEGDFPDWDPSVSVSRLLADITAEHRLLIHARLDDAMIESLGAGAIADRAGLGRLSSGFDGCGVIRAAQFG
ncbi:hypothetical protein K227x_48800 [Rubripirellula lacrimiformis]|uniref:LarA-like N-terminal domain-containing protein n=1 Tax=Rubripirellula lacrimiformis TaxID=1930273 RepID=A0A517NH56_9BACT|nr:lactate racemase domain-containing protein [Rubripirellula lacrimiformis]QDT06470.1 hypothetical protein K227x_48800 [Rubripirellula lacrimiformis]